MTGATPAAVAALLAATPITLILVLMLVMRWSAARAGLAGLLLAGLLAATVFGIGPAADRADAREFAGVFAEGGFTSLTILWILWPALALHHHQQQCGAMDAMRSALTRLTADRPQQVLLVGWFAALFFEGAAGFGTPVALAAPMLVTLGIPPVQAVVLALLGHAVGVAFGALGTPVLTQVALTGLGAVDIAWRTALLHAVLGGLLMFFFVRTEAAVTVQAKAAEGPVARRARLGAGSAATAAAGFLLPSLLLAWLLGPELATLGGALVGGALYATVLRLRAERASRVPARADRAMIRALWPYAILTLLVIGTRAVPALAEVLGSVVIRWQWTERYGAQMKPLTHPGTLLFVALLVGARLQGVALPMVWSSLMISARRLWPVTVALLAMLCLSRLMLHAGMIDALQAAAARGLGRAWPLVAPAVGALGSFITGSATASNVLFTSLQAQTAQALGLSVVWVVAAQGSGAGIGNIVCPHNVVAGAATVGLAGREGEILRRTLVPCAIYLVLGGLLVAAFTSG